jgi:hypothetical protein
VGCVGSIVLLACGDGDKRVVVLREEKDSGTPTALEERPDGSGPRCVVDDDYVSARKTCNSDADCSTFEYQPACCAEQHLFVGLASSDLEEAEICLATNKVACRCDPGLKRAEDGRVVNEGSTTGVQCIDQRCTSRVTERQCGAKRICNANEICVTYENVPGGTPPDPDSGDNALLTFRCEPNPCSVRLDCTCAQTLCDAWKDVMRKCEIKNNEESDLTCKPFID